MVPRGKTPVICLLSQEKIGNYHQGMPGYLSLAPSSFFWKASVQSGSGFFLMSAPAIEFLNSLQEKLQSTTKLGSCPGHTFLRGL